MSDHEEIHEGTHDEPTEVDTVITAKDPKKVAQGRWLAQISKKAKKDKLRKEIMDEEFSYLPYILYPLAGVSTFLLLLNMFTGTLTRRKEVQYEFIPVAPVATKEEEPKEKPKESKYKTLG